MKKVVILFVLVSLCFYTNITQAQVGVGTTAPNASAMLEIKSETLGFLPPRMTTAQRDSINSPAEGLVIFNTETKCLEWFTGSSWISYCYSSVGVINCSNSSIHGTCQPLIALDSSNYLRVEVDVSQLGSWNIITNIVNGCWFQGSGVFTSIGTNTITLTGHGTPFVIGQFNYITIFGASFCSFNVNVLECPSTISDIDGNSYNTVGIGSQCWMKENLKTTKYRNNIEIPNITDNTLWESDIAGGYCCYNNSCGQYNFTYGKLYNWFAVNNINGLCPSGWHVPSDVEWTMLINYLIANGYNYNGTTSGNNIAKAMAATTDWTYYSSVAGAVGNPDYPIYRNKSGFTALPGGGISNLGILHAPRYNGFWWSSTEYNTTNSYITYIFYSQTYIILMYLPKNWGISVRCVRDL